MANRNTIYTSLPASNIDPRMSLTYSPDGSHNLAVVGGPNVVPMGPSSLGPSPVPGVPTYIRIPNNARIQNQQRMNQNIYGSSGALAPMRTNVPQFTPNLGPPNTNFGANVGQNTMNFGTANAMSPSHTHPSIANNLNDPNNIVDKNSMNRQLNNPRNNVMRNSNIPNNSQYIYPNDLGRGGGLGTHI